MRISKHTISVGIPFRFVAGGALIAALLAASGCVSSTLVQSEVESTSLTQTPQKEPTYDLALRQAAVEEMRAKAENKNGEKTDVFRNQDGPADPLEPDEAKAEIKKLDKASKQQAEVIPDAELKAKNDSIAQMRKKLRTHYSDAVKSIEN